VKYIFFGSGLIVLCCVEWLRLEPNTDWRFALFTVVMFIIYALTGCLWATEKVDK
jgi:uncharacterized membrane protein YqjE